MRMRLLRLCLAAVALLCAVLGMSAGPASALSFNTSTDTSVTIDEDIHWWGGARAPVSSGGYQYFAYWDAPATRRTEPNLVLARRRISDNNVVRISFTTAESYLVGYEDAHNEPAVGLDANDGTINISWGNHRFGNRRHYYWSSERRCLERTQAEFRRETCGFGFRYNHIAGTNEENMTYPQYINDNQGRLYFTWRNGLAHNSDQYMNVYNESTQSWSELGRILRGRENGTYRFEINSTRYESTGRGSYLSGMAFDKNERLHVAWVWREVALEGEITGSHGLFYAYSDDLGRTWNARSAERDVRIATSRTDAIEIGDLALAKVVSETPGHIMAPGNLKIDSHNNPHIAGTVAEVPTNDGAHEGDTMRNVHMWRDTAGTWYEQYIGEETTSYEPSLFLDRQDIAYVMYPRRDIGWIPWNNPAEEYYRDLPNDNFTWQPDGAGDGLLDLQVYSEHTCIDTDGNKAVNLPITTETSGTNQVRIMMRNDTDATELTVNWTTEESTREEVTRQQIFPRVMTRRERNYQEYVLTITNREWRGTLRLLEVCTVAAISSGSQRIDWIKLTNSRTGTAAKTWEFSRGAVLAQAEAANGDNWATWTIGDLLPEGNMINAPDAHFEIDPGPYGEAGRVAEFRTQEQGAPGTESLVLHRFDITGDDSAMEWTFGTDLVGWTAGRDVTSFVQSTDVEKKVAGGTITGTDSMIYSDRNLKVPLRDEDDFLHIRLRNATAARTAKFYFITNEDRAWNEAKSKTFPITAESGYTMYNIDMSSVRGWNRSTLYQLRFDPAEDATTRSGTFKIDRIYIFET